MIVSFIIMAYVVKLTSCKNCVALHGRRQEAMPRPKKEIEKKYVRQNISMDPEQLKRVTAYCQKEERAISWVIRQALEDYLNRKVA